MLALQYTIEKEGVTLTDDRLMVSERQVNDLLDSFVANGYDVISTSVYDAEYSRHYNG